MNHYHHRAAARRHFQLATIYGIFCLLLAGFAGWSICERAIVAALSSAALSAVCLLGFFGAAEAYRKSARLARDSRPIRVERL